MTPQNVSLDPLDKIKIYLEHFRTPKYTPKYFFQPRAIFCDFLKFIKKSYIIKLCMAMILLIRVFYGPPATQKLFAIFFRISDTMAAILA